MAALDRRGVVCYRIKVPNNQTFETMFSRFITDKSSSRFCIRTRAA